MSTLTLPNGTVLTRIQRSSILPHCQAIDPGTIDYSQSRISTATDKRADCTGWVSYAWDTPDSGTGIYLKAYSTATFYTQHVIIPIAWDALLPGDTIGYYAPDSPGNGGHGAIWVGGDRFPGGRFDVVDHGSGKGPKWRSVKWDGVSTGWLHPDKLAPWRYVAIVEDDGTTYEPISGGIDGMAINDRVLLGPGSPDTADVKELQTKYKALGYDLGTSGPNGDGVDGGYGTKTTNATKAEQGKAGHAQTGSLDVKLWRVLDAPPPEPAPEPEPGEPVDYDRIRTIVREELDATTVELGSGE